MSAMVLVCLLLSVYGAYAAPTLPLAIGESSQRNGIAQKSHPVIAVESNAGSVEGSISRQNSEDSDFVGNRQSRSVQRKMMVSIDRYPSTDRYPSPHGKSSRWRFDLRHTVDTEVAASDIPFQSTLSSQLEGVSHVKRSPSMNSI